MLKTVAKTILSMSHQMLTFKKVFTDARTHGLFTTPIPTMGWDITNHFQQVTEVYGKCTNPFFYYEWIISDLLQVEALEIVPLYELMHRPAKGRRAIGLRHDIDMDPETGLRCARHLAMKGVCGSFYLLHTSPYYGMFYGDRFVRNAELTRWVREFIAAGCELGLHNDSLNLYLNYDIDGAAALAQEIGWLRGQGAVVRGTVAHNSGPVYGAENYEIFAGHKLWDHDLATDRGKLIPLGSVSKEQLGLTYEGTFAKPKPVPDKENAQRFFADKGASDVSADSWMRKFLFDNPACTYETDYQFWLIGTDRWIIAGPGDPTPFFRSDVDLATVMETVRGLPENSRSVFVIHPEYVRKSL